MVCSYLCPWHEVLFLLLLHLLLLLLLPVPSVPVVVPAAERVHLGVGGGQVLLRLQVRGLGKQGF